MKTNFLLLTLLIGTMTFSSCTKEEPIKSTNVTLSSGFSMTDKGEITVTEGTYTFHNISTGVDTETTANTINIPEGIYRVTFIGKGMYKAPSTSYDVEVTIQGSNDNVKVLGDKLTIEMELIVTESNKVGDFVLSELFLGGTLTSENKQYNGDLYFIIHNNSNKVLYADGLMFVESKFTTNSKKEYDPNIIEEAITAHAIFMFPGNGTEYPVEPGKSIILADNAIDHTTINTNSINLTKANFEWHSDLSTIDVDNPNVPNLKNIYLSAGKFWMASKQGNKAYAIGRLPKDMTIDKYLADYAIEYNWIFNNKPMPQKAYKYPNEWVLDAVTLSPSSSYEWSVLGKILDLGFTSLGETTSPTSNFGKAVIRKKDEEKSKANGYSVLVDMNNSTTDFNASVPASLL